MRVIDNISECFQCKSTELVECLQREGVEIEGISYWANFRMRRCKGCGLAWMEGIEKELFERLAAEHSAAHSEPRPTSHEIQLYGDGADTRK